MADISMCEEHECYLNKTCYRYTAKPNEHRQAYLKPKSIGNDCTLFLTNKNK